ncbi:hypothetical protein [Methanocella sp. MCL-LM]|uniref:hypothetical protein n=1 Tax=Methanocella sp. MCL-LM TaxID=3412035 RepID=UPI003C741F58
MAVVGFDGVPMRYIVIIAIALTAVLAITLASFHFTPPSLDWTGDPGQRSVPTISPKVCLISVDYLKNATKESGPGRLSSNWRDFIARGQTDVTGQAAYLGFNYTASAGAPYTTGEFYYTGESFDGRRVYVSAADPRKARVPEAIYLQAGGNFTRYAIADRPPVYAYTLCGAYNTNETVGFGLANDAGGSMELRNAAPYEIQRKEGTNWVTVFAPVAAQVIVPMENGTFREWQWNQRLDDGSLAPFGEYRAVIADRYVTSFSISADTPSVERTQQDFTRESAEDRFVSPPQAGSLTTAYPPAPYSEQLRRDIASEMMFKAWAHKLDPASLRAAINATGMQDDETMLPCLAVRATYEGRPAWIVVFTYGGREVMLSHVRYFVVGDDGTIVAAGPISV